MLLLILICVNIILIILQTLRITLCNMYAAHINIVKDRNLQTFQSILDCASYFVCQPISCGINYECYLGTVHLSIITVDVFAFLVFCWLTLLTLYHVAGLYINPGDIHRPIESESILIQDGNSWSNF